MVNFKSQSRLPLRTVTFIVCLFLLWGNARASYDYTGDKVFSVTIRNVKDWDIVQEISADNVETVDTWKEPLAVGDSAHLHIARAAVDEISALFDRHGLLYHVLIKDVQSAIDNEKASNEVAKRRKLKKRVRKDASQSVSNALIGTYATLDETYTWLRELASFFADITELKSIGTSFEDRDILVLKIGLPKPYNKPAIFIESAAHSREWISPATANYMIYSIYNGYQQGDPYYVKLLSDLDWYFVPIANPDGYVYSHEKSRLWRKNRMIWPVHRNRTASCKGVDLNRNWPFKWAEGGGSSNPCSSLYQGPTAGSEYETRALSNFLLENNQTIVAYLTVHSYSQLFLTRFSYANATYPEDHQHLLSVNKEIVNVIHDTHGEWYKYGTSPQRLYAYSGGSPDWAKGVAGIKYSYAAELRDTGTYGFVLPADFILPTSEEFWEGVKVLAKYAAQIVVAQDTTTEETTSTTTSTTTATMATTPRVQQVASKANSYQASVIVNLLATFLVIHITVFQCVSHA